MLGLIGWFGHPSRWPFTAVALVALSTLMIVYRIRHGINITDDSEAYLDRARAASAGDLAFSRFSDSLHFPPLYPWVVALVARLPFVGPAGAGVTLNVAAIAALLLGLDRLTRALYRSPALPGAWLVVLGGMVTVSAPVMRLGSSVLSDLSFFALWMWLLVLLVRTIDEDRPTPWPALLGTAMAVALIRYNGVFLLAGACLALVGVDAARRRWPWRGVVLGAVGVAPLALWVAWVRAVSPSPELAGGDGVLGWPATVTDSIEALGSQAAGVKQARVDGVLGRGSFELPGPLADAVALLAVVLAVVLVGLALAALVPDDVPEGDEGRPLAFRLRSIAVASLAGMAAIAVVRISSGYFVLQRYWGIVPVVLLLVAARREVGRAYARAGLTSTLLLAIAVANAGALVLTMV